MNNDPVVKIFDANTLTQIFISLKQFYGTHNISEDRRNYISQIVQEYGYLPYSHQKALEELTTAETLIGLEEKLKLNGIYKNSVFTFDADTISPVKRAGYTDSSWLCKEQLNIKLINLAALGNGNNSVANIGKFSDWIKQILTAFPGKLDFGILGTVMYLVPFHPRDFGCAYIPRSKFISPMLEDKELSQQLQLNLAEQVKLFLLLSQLSGHPIMYDVLAQTGRYSKTIIANPFIARWFDIPELNRRLKIDLNNIAGDLKKSNNSDMVNTVKKVIANSLDGISENSPEGASYLEEKMEMLLDYKRKEYSEEMTSVDYQEKLLQRIKKVINNVLGYTSDKNITEDDIGENHDNIIKTLITEGFWPAPGGAWTSCGVPIYSRMISGGGHPLFKHYDVDGLDITHLANLDCQTPFYFMHLENCNYNRPVIDFWCNYLVELQQQYNFDAFRFDHVDHIADRVSVTKDGKPISYRVPAMVLKEAINKLREKKSYFGALAEYMLWDGFLKEYHQDMGFDLLWGSDIVYQYAKNVKVILQDSAELKQYNNTFSANSNILSILKTYNNQDGEFKDIDQYPGQLKEEGALFKWFKLKFLPFGPKAERPVMFIDGDESFTQRGAARVISVEIPLKRNNSDFFRKFAAINKFALFNTLCRYGTSEICYSSELKNGLVAWSIKKQSDNKDDERLFIVANENPPCQFVRKAVDRNNFISELQEYRVLSNAKITVPEGFGVDSEYILPEGGFDYVQRFDINNLKDRTLTFNKLYPSEFHIYKLKKL